MAAAAKEAFPGCALYTPHLACSRLVNVVPPEAIAANLLDAVDVLVREGNASSIVIVGHSMGSLIARKLAILAHGETDSAPFEAGLERHREAKPWAGRVERLILLAGMSRGWSPTAAHAWLIATGLAIVSLIGDTLFNGRWTFLSVRRGAPFVVQSRLQWLALVQQRREKPIVVVQLLGSVDNTVSPDDTVDFAVDLGTESFVLIDLPATDHKQALELDGPGPAAERRRRFIAALTRSVTSLRDTGDAVPPTFAANGPPPAADPKVTDVVFVIHGIRDRGFWTQKIARKVMEEARSPRVVRAMTLSYGYLAMLPFILPWVRRDKVRWLMDRYADCRALYPNADFFYVGHSNGTYLVARALRDYPAARFKRIVLAGSVVRTDYDWQSLVTGSRRQAEQILNYVASGDWVVAIFPHGLSPFRPFDLGGAGHRGFTQLASTIAGAEVPRISSVPLGDSVSHQVYYVGGGHGAGVKESQWDDIARFVADGAPPVAVDPDYVPRQSRWVVAAGSWPPVAFAMLTLLLLGTIAAACFLMGAQFGIGAALLTAFVCAVLLYVVLTKF
ncbi:MAG: hypothetical protein ABWX67_11485 [Allosphingosinicella sp.]